MIEALAKSQSVVVLIVDRLSLVVSVAKMVDCVSPVKGAVGEKKSENGGWGW